MKNRKRGVVKLELEVESELWRILICEDNDVGGCIETLSK